MTIQTSVCAHCPRPAVMWVNTTRSPDGSVRTTVFWDEGKAPKKADHLCKEHGHRVLTSLVEVLAL